MSDHEFVSDLHRAAREYAAKGWPVFPIHPGTKVPATEHGFHDATTDPGQIDFWWREDPQRNIAFSPHTVGLSVVDLDGPEAETNWAGLQLVNGEVETYEVQTPRGRHLYFAGELPPTQSKLAAHVDTRGRGSYALLPPSRTEHGGYRVSNPRAAAPVPSWVVELASHKREKAKAVVRDLDLPQNVDRARAYLRTCPPAIEGQMGDKQTFVTACDVLNLGVSETKAFELMLDIYNPRCVPEWDPEELEIKIANAAAYAQNEAGAWATGSPQDLFGDVLGRMIASGEIAATPEPSPAGGRFKPVRPEDIAARPKPDWLIPEMIPGRRLVMLYAPPDSFKSVVVANLALTVAQAVDVIVVAGEDAEGFAEFVQAGRSIRGTDDHLWLIEEAPFADDDDALGEFARAVGESGVRPKLIVVDTASKMFGDLDENSARDMNKFVRRLSEMAKAMDTTVLVVHHTGKDASRGARGSNALLGGFDVMLEVSADHQQHTAAVHVRKMKGAPRRKVPFAYELKQINGSIVAQDMDPRELRARTEADDLIGQKRVVRYLRDLKAFGAGRAVSSHVLASHAIQHSTDIPDDPDVLEERARLLAGVLKRRAKGNLAAFTYGEGEALKWGLPAEDGT